MTKGSLPGDPKAAPPSMQQAAHLKRLGLAAGEELRKTVRSTLTDLFAAFVQRLPADFTELAFGASDLQVQHAFGELAMLVAEKGAGWLETYVQRVDEALTGGEAARREVPGEPRNSEAAVQSANAELRAESLHRKTVGELDARVDRLRLLLYIPIYTRAVAPASLVRTLQETATEIGWPASQRQALFQRFDQAVVPQLGQLYESLIASIKVISTAATRASQEGPAQPAAPAPAAAPPPSPPIAPPMPVAPVIKRELVPPPQIDPNTVSMLKNFAGNAIDGAYTDGSLAADLLSLTGPHSIPGVADDQRWVPLQRMSLAGRFINEAIADAMLPEEFRSQHESVRFPVVKSALADSTLFTAATHPINSLVNDLMLKSATSRLTGNAEARRAVERLQQVLVQFDLAPEFVREAMLTQAPIDEAQIQKFFEWKKEEAEARRQAILGEVRRLVMRQVEMATFGRNVPEPAMKFLTSAWGPLLMKRLLQHGAEHDQWKQGLKLMEELIDEVDQPFPDQDTEPWDKLMKTLTDGLIAIGMAAERIAASISGLQAARPGS
ncbi:DUF1631 family protein [Solimonas sp. K1W22B-7]|uniref:DUF1631 family protein n=1 Tax=Solimonas sp. K1W22B-7 TaxID=2303331 RepID=UPI0013C4A1E4|nr:DUF1631 family protein [Solimonas sp. K1W22B-7]